MISFVLPVYNCYSEFEGSLPEFIQYMKQLNDPYEVIVVDDGSDEGECFKRLAEGYQCVYIRNEKNSGKGYSVKMGFSRAHGDLLIFMDGDFPFHLDVIRRVIDAFQDRSTDIVIGDRTLAGSDYEKKIPFMRQLGSKSLSFFAGNYFTPGYYDTQCGIKGFRRPVAESIFSVTTVNGFSFDIEVLYIALKRKYTVERVAVGIGAERPPAHEHPAVRLVDRDHAATEIFHLPGRWGGEDRAGGERQ